MLSSCRCLSGSKQQQPGRVERKSKQNRDQVPAYSTGDRTVSGAEAVSILEAHCVAEQPVQRRLALSVSLWTRERALQVVQVLQGNWVSAPRLLYTLSSCCASCDRRRARLSERCWPGGGADV